MPQRELEAKMQEQGRQEQAGAKVTPVNRPVDRVEFTGITKRIKDKRSQTDEIEVQRMRSARPLQEDENPNEKVDQADQFEIFLMSNELFGYSRNDGGPNFLVIANEGICSPLP